MRPLLLLAGLLLAGGGAIRLVPGLGGGVRERVTTDPRPARAIDALGIDFLERRRWRALPPRGKMPPLGAPRRVTVHHRGGPPFLHDDIPAVARAIHAIQDYHQKERGWLDIAYHLVVDRAGRIWEARPLEYRGAHAGDARLNAGNVGILLLGNYDVQTPTEAEVLGLRRLLEAIEALWDIGPSAWLTHDEVRRQGGKSGTRCPGEHLSAVVRKLRSGTDRAEAPAETPR